MNLSSFLNEQRKRAEEHLHNVEERNRGPKPSGSVSYTVMIRGLPTSANEKDIKRALEDERAVYTEVRLVKDRKSQISRGLAFVDFKSIEDARRFVRDSRGEMSVRGVMAKLSFGASRDEHIDRSDEPSATIMVRGLTMSIDERDIRQTLDYHHQAFIDVRVIRDKETGMTRGFGFVEFASVDEAKHWMDSQNGIMRVRRQELRMSYSSSRAYPDNLALSLGRSICSPDVSMGDWICSRCSSHNFKRRDNCYKCQLPRAHVQSVANSEDGSDLVGTTPCNTLIIRCLDALTREDDISNLFQNKMDVKVRQCHVMRDEITLTSRCYAFVELPTVADAYKIIDSIGKSDQIFEMGGKAVTVNYAKNTYNTIMASLKAEGSYNAQLASSRGLTLELAQVAALHAANNAPVSTTTLAINAVAASALLNPHVSQQAQTAQLSQLQQQQLVEEKAKQYQQQIAAVVHGTDHVPSSFKSTSSPTSASVQLPTLPVPTIPFSAATCATTLYPHPDTSRFIYDENTRYYYDPVTGLLYDTNSTYFFDRASSQYFFWDRSRNLYVPVPPTGLSIQITTVDTNQNQTQPIAPVEADVDNEHVKKKIEKEKKEKTAKKIAKEMEKWAKRMNSQKEALATANSSSRTADIGCALLEASLSSVSHATMGSNLLTNSANPVLSSSLVASYGDGDESDEGNVSPVAASGLTAPRSAAESKVADEEARLFDWTKLACLLCSRGFKDVATLQKHKAFSALHFTNLNKLRAKYDLPPVQPPSGSAASNPTISSNELTTLPESLSIDALLQLGAVTASNHAKNAAARHRIASEQANALAQAVYRDRAKERRDRYGTSSPPRRRKRADSPPPSPIPTPPPPSHSSAVNTSPQPATTSAEPAGANVGSRLMEKMGWQAGQGLGRANQGRTQIIEAEFREHGVGLGIKNSKRGPPSDNYKDNVKRAMFARFHELE